MSLSHRLVANIMPMLVIVRNEQMPVENIYVLLGGLIIHLVVRDYGRVWSGHNC